MKKTIVLTLGVLISVACLWFVFKDVNLASLGRAIVGVHPGWLLLSTAVFYLSMYLRAVRWGLLFRPNYELSGRQLYRPLMICFAFNSVMPARAGEFVRAFYVSRRGGDPPPSFATAMATVVSERIFDAVVLLSLLAFSLSRVLPDIDPEFQVEVMNFTVRGDMIEPLIRKLIVASAVLVGGVIFMMIPGVEKLLVRIIEGAPALPDGLRGGLIGFIRGVIQGFEAIRSPANLVKVIGYSFVLWLMVAGCLLALAQGMEGMGSMTPLQSVAIMALICVAILVPAAPGYWGLYEAGCVFSIRLLGIQNDMDQATAFAISSHLIQFLPIVVIGFWFAWRDQVRVQTTPTDAHPNADGEDKAEGEARAEESSPA